jgi:hypothetical protein
MEDDLNLPIEADPIEANKPVRDYFADTNSFGLLQRFAKMMASSQLVPEVYRGNVADCAMVIMLARTAGLDPFFFMHHSFPHKGRIGLDAQIAITLLRRRFKKVRFQYSGEGESRACTCIVIDADGDEFQETVSIKMAKDFGWLASKSEKMTNFWAVMPDRMLAYRSASFLAKLYCPDLLAGAQFEDEILDVDGVQVVRQSKAKNLQERLSASVNKPASSED